MTLKDYVLTMAKNMSIIASQALIINWALSLNLHELPPHNKIRLWKGKIVT
jgi:hypothetical protein